MNVVKDILNDNDKLNNAQGIINAIITDSATEEFRKADMNQQQLEAFERQSQNISTQLHTFDRGPVYHSRSGWVIHPLE